MYPSNQYLKGMRPFLNKIALFSLLIAVSFASAQNEIHFSDAGYQAALQRSKKEHKPVFYLIYANWCAHCNKMKSEVFKDPDVADFMNANFVCAWQDIEKGEGNFFKKQYKIRAFPTFLFIDENGRLLYNFNGEFKSADFLTEVRNAMVPEKQLWYLEQQFYAEPTNAKKCLDFLVTMKKGSDRTALNPHAQKYLSSQSDEQLVSETNWKIIANGVSDIESHPFQYVLKHQKEFAAVSSPKRVQRKIDNIVTELLEPYTETLDTVQYLNKRAIAKSVNTQKADSIIFRNDIFIAEKVKNWKWYAKANTESAEKFVWTDALILKQIGQNYAQNINNAADLKFAVKLTQHSLELNDSYDTEVVLSKLYAKTNDHQQALLYAEKAKKRNGDLGFSTKEADDLLQQLGNK